MHWKHIFDAGKIRSLPFVVILNGSSAWTLSPVSAKCRLSNSRIAGSSA